MKMNTSPIFIKIYFTVLPFAVAAMAAVRPAAAAEVLQEKPVAKIHMIVIGVSKFSDQFWPELKWAEADAKAFATKAGVGTSHHKVVTLLTNEQANLGSVRKKLSEIESSARRDDIVLLYVSSHGTLRLDKSNTLEPLIVLHNSDHNSLLKTALSHNELRGWMSRLKTRKKAIVLATCHSGVGKSKFTTEVSEFKRGVKGAALRPLDSVSEGSLILAASSRNEIALESDLLKGDVYSHFLLEALDAGDRNSDGAVSILEAHDYARIRAYSFTKGRQRPTLETEMVGDVDFSLAGTQKDRGVAILEAYASKYEGYSVEVGKGERVELPTAVPLPTGPNTVRVYEPDDKTPREFVFNADAGEKVSLNELFAPPRYYLGFSADLMTPSDSRFAKAAGQNDFFEPKLTLGLHRDFFDIHFFYNLTRSFSAFPLTNLNSRLRLDGAGIQAGFAYAPLSAFPLLAVKPAFQLARNTRELSFRDISADETQSRATVSWSYGYAFDLVIPFFRSRVAYRVGVGNNFEKVEFSDFGSIDMSSVFFRMGVSWYFGAKAWEL